jgi:hypothetical protein
MYTIAIKRNQKIVLNSNKSAHAEAVRFEDEYSDNAAGENETSAVTTRKTYICAAGCLFSKRFF